MVGKGWHLESQRHSTARRYGSAGGKMPKKFKTNNSPFADWNKGKVSFSDLKKDDSVYNYSEADEVKDAKKEVKKLKAKINRSNQIKVNPKKIKSTTLTDEESNAYDDAMTQYNGNEKKVVKDLEQEFPRLKNYKKWI